MSFILEPGLGGLDLVVTGEWSPEARAVLMAGGADGLVLNYARGFHEGPIDFIEGLPIRRLNLLARSVDDLGPVYSLPFLEELRVQSDPRAVIELERLPLLKVLAAYWRQVQGSIMFAPQLVDVSLPAYTEPDLSPLENLSLLESMVMKQRPKLRSLDGVEAFPFLSNLGIYGARGLEDISALERLVSPALQVLRFPSCRQVPNIDPVAACTGLTFFELSEAGNIPSVRALRGLNNLIRLYLYGSTTVEDGDLSPIAGLPLLKDFRMMNRRHYKPSAVEIENAIAQRREGV